MRTLKLFFAIVILFLIPTLSWGQVTILSNNCSAATSGWTYTNTVSGLAIQQSGYQLLQATSTVNKDVIITETIDVSTFTNLVLTLDVATYGSGTNHNGLIEYSLDNGSTWSTTTYTTATPTSSTYISSGTINLGTLSTSTLKIKFTLNATSDKALRIKNILLKGDLSSSTPEIQTQMPSGTNLVCGGTYNFGSFLTGTTNNQILRIQNSGTVSLDVSGYPLSGTDAAEFSLSPSSTSTSIAASSYYDVTVTYSPITAGSKTAAITIGSNDSDEGSCIINLTGTAVAPAPEVQTQIPSGTNLACGGSYNFGSFLTGTTNNQTLRIQNTGTSSLDVTGYPLSGTDAAEFSLSPSSTSTSIAASSYYDVTVTYSPITAGSKTAAITIGSNDSDEGSCIINLTGTATAPAPEINVKGNSVNIADGDATASTTDHTDFGSVDVSSGTVVRTFTIENLGTAALNLTGSSPYVSISGTHAADFSVTAIPSSSVAVLGSTTFQITFDPSASGVRNAEISIANDDSNENPYNFAIKGTGAVSNETDFVTAGGESTSMSSISNDLAINTTADGVQMWQFTIREGGSDLSDVDVLPTIINSITIAQAAGNEMSNWADAIQACALFDGATKLGDAVITTTQLQFTGTPFISIPDGTSKTLTLRLSLQLSSNDSGDNDDNEDFVFSIDDPNVTVDPAGSGLASFSAASSINEMNMYDVDATELRFTIQPTTTGVGAAMTPDVAVSATDANGNLDSDYTGTVTLTSTGTMTGAPLTDVAAGGIAIFIGIIHSVAGTNFYMTASDGSFTDVNSSNYDISNVTVLEPGDFAILAVNTAAESSGSADEISFVCFKDLLPGTQIFFTDNGYERKFAGLWGETEGIVSMTRTTSTLTKGTIITIHTTDGGVNAGSDFTVYTCGGVDGNWAKSVVNSSFSFDLNKDDQVWFMQGGSWGEVDGDGTHNATYTGGNVLYGWTDIPWKTAINYASTAGSTIYPGMTCFNTDVNNTVTGASHVKFDDPIDPDFSSSGRNKLDWVALINDTGNWDYYTSDGTYDAGGYDYLNSSSCPEMVIDAGTYVDGKWTGEYSTNWFECENWNTFVVPTSSVDVLIPNTGITNEPTIGDPALNSQTAAYCNHIDIESDRTLTMNHAASRLDVYGNMTVDGIIDATAGTVNVLQDNSLLDGTGLPYFYNLTLNKTASSDTWSLTADIDVSGTLNLSNGIVLTGANRVEVSNTATTAITGHDANSYINGNLRRYVDATGSYDFPVGTASNFELANITLNSSSGINYFDARFSSHPGSSALVDGGGQPLNLTIAGTELTEMLDAGFWTVTPNAVGAVNYKATLTSRGHTNGGSQAGQHTIVKRHDATIDWACFDALHDNSTQTGTGSLPITAVLNGLTDFSDFAIARNASFPLPVSLIDFTAHWEQSQVKLIWQTASEFNNEYFLVEKSSNANHYTLLDQVWGQGQSNSITSYFTLDPSPYQGTTYYRLSQRDYDGTLTVIAHISVSQSRASSFAIRNNQLFGQSTNNDAVNVEIYNALGQKLELSQKLNAESLQYDLSHLESGSVYIIRIQSSQNEEVIKWVKP